jgi:hypothetical protein
VILKNLLQRLYAGLADGPGLNARPHHSRQRIDLAELQHLGLQPASSLLASLLNPSRGVLDLTVRVSTFEPPDRPEREWTEPQRASHQAYTRQSRLLDKLRDIATDAGDYLNDHGESSLFVGFPLLSLPPVADRSGLPSRRVLAPVAFIPVNLRVRRGASIGITLEATGEGSDRLIPNPALLAWLEQQTGTSTEALFAEDVSEDPWRELATLLALVAKASRIHPVPTFDQESVLEPVPRTDALPTEPTLLSAAVLGLFPTANPGLLRDTVWMRDHEDALTVPVSTFLRPEAITPTSPSPKDQSDQSDPSDPSDRTDQTDPQLKEARFPVAPADPCQSQAVAHARHSPALVIHGPPGTGKSQTIANIIGDHLARGERVLFVCDKRTALDVVHFRLNALGLGGLCGVIHDAQGDRRDLYLHLRSLIDDLAESTVLPDPAADLDRLNLRLDALHAELTAAFRHLHETPGTRSFHELCGEWLALRSPALPELPDIEGLTPDRLQGIEADCEEIITRALRARWPTNPYRDRLALSPEAWQARTPAAWASFFQEGTRLAAQADALPQGPGPRLSPSIPLPDQALHRRGAATWLEKIHQRNDPDLAARFADGSDPGRWLKLAADLAPSATALDTPLDRELWPQVRDQLPGLADLRRQKLALQQWAEVAGSWTRFFAFGKRSAAKPILDRLALPMDPASTERALRFLGALELRWQWSEVRAEILGLATAGFATDGLLVGVRDGLPELAGLHAALTHEAAQPFRAAVLEALRNPESRPALLRALRESSDHALALEGLQTHWQGSGFLRADAMGHWIAELCTGTPALPPATQLTEAAPTLEDAVRLTARLNSLPTPVITGLREITSAGLTWEIGFPALRMAALAHEMRRRLRQSPDLARIDSARVDAALGELGRLSTQKTTTVRALILHRWQKRWRERLLASTGTRLNSLGASLRQRLFVRGQRALKLRQMIATGAGTEGGDPLFDLCPVWMASPATVAQVFPREALFDVVIFDEASQCRLEEALPVLLRARRVVIAGDPKQLPPTRFFEAANTESDDTAAETAAEVFDRQQSEAEDLLSAALNLSVQEAFLDVHYRSRDAALIGFSNEAFYNSRLLPLPGHPERRAPHSPIQLQHVDGTYADRGNEAEALAAVDIVVRLLALPKPPSIGIACFNLPQRDLILDALDDRAAADPEFAERLATARERQGSGSFEGLFVKNLENVQGDERDHLILCTTFGPDAEGKFRRNFGALSRTGGERRLNVLVTRAREAVHILTSIPRAEYAVAPAADSEARITGRHYLYAYLRYAEACLRTHSEDTQRTRATTLAPACTVRESRRPSTVATALGQQLHQRLNRNTTVHWGNDGFCVDIALDHGTQEAPETLGILTDFNRYTRAPDPIAWEQFRTQTLTNLGWNLQRVWSPALFRDPTTPVA